MSIVGMQARNESKPVIHDESKLISVVITSYHLNKANIKDVLMSLKKQSYRKLEIIYVTEGNVELKEYAAKLLAEEDLNGCVIHKRDTMTLGTARNVGASSAKGDMIAFLDDDIVLPKEYIEGILSIFSSDGRIVGATGHAVPLPVNSLNIWLPKSLHWDISCTTWLDSDRRIPVRNVWGHAMIFKRSAFVKAGGFTDNSGFHLARGKMEGIGEDVALSMRIREATGGLIVFDPTVYVLHKVDKSKLKLGILSARAIWIGRTRRAVWRRQDDKTFENKLLMSILSRRGSRPLPGSHPTPESIVGSCVIFLSLLVGYFMMGYRNS